MAQVDEVVIVGGGIGGLVQALTLHQIGVDCVVLERVTEMQPLGVGINLQPNAVRELFDLGLNETALDQVGVQAEEWALVGLNGKDVHAELRGLKAGYNWPQYAVHRGAFHMLLFREVLRRLGPGAVRLGTKVTRYEHLPSGAVRLHVVQADGTQTSRDAKLVIAADGIHSAVRAQMHPAQPPIHWGGMLMWRGTVRMQPLRTMSSFVGLGTHRHRLVIYPISKPDADGLSLVNWIAEITKETSGGWTGDGWFRAVELAEFAHHFEEFRYDWLDVPAMLAQADCAYENPMIDRDPVASWVDGPVALMGDAAHAMFPTGSNGASQAIIDARVIGAKLVEHGLTPKALAAYDAELCAPVSEVVLRNRGAGPFGLLDLLHERCGGNFDEIEHVLPQSERAQFMARYKAAAGFAKDSLNASAPTIDASAHVTKQH